TSRCTTATTHYSLSIHPAPHAPLFPYTTLFRSPQIVGPGGAGGAAPRNWYPRLFTASVMSRTPLLSVSAASKQAGLPACFEAAEDRKSTRLNSSHDQRSYAVFCLKKERESPPTG